jgi:UDP-N-acetyl-D-glucosamine dehydrogenase
VHLFGIAYKRDVNDMRESPALDIIELLLKRGAVVSYTDPYVPAMSHAGHEWRSVEFEQALTEPCDCAVIATDHAAFDYPRIAAMPLVVDTRNAIKSGNRPGLFRL